MSDDDRRQGGRVGHRADGGRTDAPGAGVRPGRPDTVVLYLVRHAHAGDSGAWPEPDETRPLSAKGEKQARRVAAFLARAAVRPAVLLTSPKLRASQTAEPIAAALGMPARTEPLLASGADLEDVERILVGAGDPPSVLLVGHDPDFSELAARLTGALSLPVPKGSVVRIDAERPLVPGSGVLRWLLPPDLLAQA
jgi:phosphohistidine phosphatase